MNVEADLVQELERHREASQVNDQLAEFEAFRDQLRTAGVEIRREKFSIPLMERVGFSLA